MPIQDHEPRIYHYVRWKAALFGALPAALGLLMVWVGVAAIDPTWTAQVSKGQNLVDAPNWLRSPVILATAIVLLIPSCWLLWASITHATVVETTDLGIVAHTMFGRKRSVAWASIVDAKRKKNQLVLSPVGTDTVLQEIWDRRSVFLDIGMLDAPVGAMEALVHRHRPDIAFRDAK